jgi:hypothetical protein
VTGALQGCGKKPYPIFFKGNIMAVTIIIIITGLVALSCIYMLIKNQIVYKVRTNILYNDIDTYMKLPPYDKMLNNKMYLFIFTKHAFLKKAGLLGTSKTLY